MRTGARVETDEVALEATRHDRPTQTLKSQHVVITEAATRLLPVHIRCSWPSELDLMARLAGLTPAGRLERVGPFPVDVGER